MPKKIGKRVQKPGISMIDAGRDTIKELIRCKRVLKRVYRYFEVFDAAKAHESWGKIPRKQNPAFWQLWHDVKTCVDNENLKISRLRKILKNDFDYEEIMISKKRSPGESY